MSAGLASTVAAAITSKFGVAGTILGAGVTAMLVTGGAAVLKSYMESAAGKMREAPSRFKERTAQRKQDTPRFGNGSNRSGFLGRLTHAFGWFTRLPALNRKSILKRGLLGALAALVIGVVFITVTEFLIGNSLACGFWGKCQAGATPGIHLTGADRAANGAGGSFTSLGSPKNENVVPGAAQEQQNPSIFGGDGEQPSPSTSTSTASPDTASPEAAPEESPSTASPEAAPEESPSTASPQAEPQGTPSSASPQAAPAE